MSLSRGRILLAIVLVVAVVVGVALIVVSRDRVAAAQSVQVSQSDIPTPNDPRRYTAAYIGDSYTAGTGSSDYDHRYPTLVSAYEGWDFDNFAYGGTGYVTSVAANAAKGCGVAFCPTYYSVIPELKELKPNVIVVSGGRNDLGKPDATIKAGVDRFYSRLRDQFPDATIYAVSPIWANTRPPAQITRMQGWVKSSVQSAKGTYLDIGEPLAKGPGLVGGDKVHPNDAGNAAIANAIEVALSKVNAKNAKKA